MPRFLFGSKNLQVPVRFLISFGSILVLQTFRVLSCSKDHQVPRILWFLGYQGSCLASYILRFLSGSFDLQVLIWFLRSSGVFLILQIFWFLPGSQIFRFLSSSYQSSKNSSFLSVFFQFPVSFLSFAVRFLSFPVWLLGSPCSCQNPRISRFLSVSQDLQVPVFVPRVSRFLFGSQDLQVLVWFLGSVDFVWISRFLSGSWILQVLSSLMFKSQDSSRETNSALYPGAQPFKLNSIKNKHCIVTFPLHLNLTLYTSQPSST